MTKDQKEAYNEMGQLIMDKTGCSSEEASKQIEMLMQGMLDSLNEGVLA
ncbi:MAG: hypothetical protein ACJA0H_001136 [Francisellaceae bacterium]|jgi:hypothetical protein